MTDPNISSTDRAPDMREEYEQVYEQPDPRAYFRIHHGLDYRLPELASPLFRSVAEAVRAARDARPKILDVGCGFGINAALLRFPLDMSRLAHRARDLDTGDLGARNVVELDRNYFASWPIKLDCSYIGFDVSHPTVAYAKAAGLIDDGFSRDLEQEPMVPAEREMIAGSDLFISTGCAGYLTEASFDRLFDAVSGPRPWVAVFVQRVEPFEALRTYFESCGMRVEKLEGVTFIQRRFHSSAEWTKALMTLEAMDIATDGKEADGLLHSEFYLIRPDRDAETIPMEDIVSVSSGTEATFGGWHGRPWGT